MNLYKLKKQYYLRPSERGLLAWDIQRLIELSSDLPRFKVQVNSVRELEEPFWFSEGSEPTVKDLLVHVRLIQEADLNFPIIQSSDGRIMDGMYRVAKAKLEGQKFIEAVKFQEDPEPDYVGLQPDELPLSTDD